MQPRLTGESELDGRVVLLTGGTSGIGLALSRALRAHGAHVVVLDRAAGPADGGDLPGQHHLVVGDVTDPDANARAVAEAVARFGRLDAFIGNAGVHDGGVGVIDLPLGQLADLARRVIEVNVLGYLLGAAAAAEAVIAAEGVMVFTLSDASFVVRGNGAGVAYATSKHAGLGLVRSLAAQLAPRVRVNAVAPGGVPTGLRGLTADGERPVYADVAGAMTQIRSINPLQTVLASEDLVGHYIYLLTSQSRGLTGHVLRPDGGLGVA